MYLWLLLFAGAFVHCSTAHWEPCKGQCINNYKENDIVQESLASACQKGCDLLTVAFISTSQQTSLKHETKPSKSSKQKRSTTLILHLFGSRPNAHLRLTDDFPKTKNEFPKSTTHNNKSPSSVDIETTVQSDERKTLTGELHFPHHETPSKTTVEPTSQPVQEHPVEANRQTTTTNGPRGDAKPNNPKKENHNTDVKKTRNLKHSSKHSSTLKHEAMKKHHDKKGDENKINNNNNSNNLSGKHELSKNEHLNMKERLEQAKHTCRQECILTYLKASEQEACVVGCNLQLTTLSLNDSGEKSKEELEPQPKSLLGMFQHVIFNFAGRVGKLFRVGWSMVASSPPQTVTEKPQVFGTEGINRGPQMPFFFGFRPSSLQEQMERRMESIREEQNNAIKLINEEILKNKGEPFENSLIFTHHNSHSNLPRIFTIFKKETLVHHKNKAYQFRTSKPDGSHAPKQDDEIIKLDDDYLNKGIMELNTKPSDRQGGSKEQMHHQLDLLECISRKSGLPRWFIAITIFSSAIVVLWLCFSLTAPPDEIKVVKTKPPELESFISENDEYDDIEDDLDYSEKKCLLTRVDDVIQADDVTKNNFQNV